MSHSAQSGKDLLNLRKGIDFIGVGVTFFCHDGNGSFVMHKRGQNSRDEHGRWDFGGGSMEFGETFEATVRREVKEEYGADALAIQFLGGDSVLRQIKDKQTHWISMMYGVKVDPDKVRNMEPHKIDELGWFTRNKLPNPRHTQFDRYFQYAIDAGLV